jgi:plasmid stabilization system protein ParE
MLSILRYIAIDLSNPDAAEKFRSDVYNSISLLLRFPELHPVEFKIKYEYRKIVIANNIVLKMKSPYQGCYIIVKILKEYIRDLSH